MKFAQTLETGNCSWQTSFFKLLSKILTPIVWQLQSYEQRSHNFHIIEFHDIVTLSSRSKFEIRSKLIRKQQNDGWNSL